MMVHLLKKATKCKINRFKDSAIQNFCRFFFHLRPHMNNFSLISKKARPLLEITLVIHRVVAVSLLGMGIHSLFRMRIPPEDFSTRCLKSLHELKTGITARVLERKRVIFFSQGSKNVSSRNQIHKERFYAFGASGAEGGS